MCHKMFSPRYPSPTVHKPQIYNHRYTLSPRHWGRLEWALRLIETDVFLSSRDDNRVGRIFNNRGMRISRSGTEGEVKTGS
jgi:hypothetical protein